MVVGFEKRVFNLALSLLQVVFDAFQFVYFLSWTFLAHYLRLAWWHCAVLFALLFSVRCRHLPLPLFMPFYARLLRTRRVNLFMLMFAIFFIVTVLRIWILLCRHLTLMAFHILGRHLPLFLLVLSLFLLVLLVNLFKLLQLLSQVYHSAAVFICWNARLLTGHWRLLVFFYLLVLCKSQSFGSYWLPNRLWAFEQVGRAGVGQFVLTAGVGQCVRTGFRKGRVVENLMSIGFSFL